MRILLTGVTGQVGRALLQPLSAVGEVIAADRQAMDFSLPQRIGEILNSLSPDIVINPAAYTAVDKAESERDLAYTVNAEAPAEIAKWTAKHNALLIHFSSEYVFDGSGERPWREDEENSSLSVYGASKLTGDKAVRSAGGSHLIVRTSWVYAATGNNFLQKILQMSKRQKEIRVVNDQFGAPTSAVSIANVVQKFVTGDKETIAAKFAKSNGLINVANSGVTTWHEFAEAIVAGAQRRNQTIVTEKIVGITSEEFGAPAKRPHNSRLDLSRLKTLFGITPLHWRDALDSELDRLGEQR